MKYLLACCLSIIATTAQGREITIEQAKKLGFSIQYQRVSSIATDDQGLMEPILKDVCRVFVQKVPIGEESSFVGHNLVLSSNNQFVAGTTNNKEIPTEYFIAPKFLPAAKVHFTFLKPDGFNVLTITDFDQCQ